MNLEVNGVLIRAEEIRAEAAQYRQEAAQNGQEVTLDHANELLARAETSLIRLVLLDQEAVRLGLDAPGMDRRLRIETLLELWGADFRPPPAKALRQLYAHMRERFRISESFFVQQIVKNVHHEDERDAAKAAMEAVSAELKRGGDFLALVAAHSDCPEQNGAVGFIARGEMVPEFDAAVLHLPLKRPSEVFETRFGFHIARVLEHQRAGVLPFESVVPRLKQILMTQAFEEEVAQRVKLLHASASIRRVKP